MTYSTSITVDFPSLANTVFKALTNLGEYPSWNSGMVTISPTAVMSQGLQFESTSIVMGREITSNVSVVSINQNQSIELTSDRGPIAYHATYTLEQSAKGITTVICLLEFELKSFALNLAHSAIESMAASRIKGDLEALRTLVCAPLS